MTPEQVLHEFNRERLKDWDVRVIYALKDLNVHDRVVLTMLLCALPGVKSGPIRAPRFGGNAIIKKDGLVWTRFTNSANVDRGETAVMTVDQLNKYLGWIMKAIDASDEEYTIIVNKVASWISRDETTIGLHVERQRAALEEPQPDLSGVLEDIKKAEEKRRALAGEAGAAPKDQ